MGSKIHFLEDLQEFVNKGWNLTDKQLFAAIYTCKQNYTVDVATVEKTSIMQLISTRLSRLGVFVGLAGILPQVFWMPAIQAQSTVEQRLCRHNGRYVIFAQRPLKILPGVQQPRSQDTYSDRHNLQFAHEHIFFCNNGKIERNIGFGPDGRFSEETLSENYALIDDERYDSDIIRLILPEQCYASNPDGEYGFRSNNCQDFADRVKQQ